MKRRARPDRSPVAIYHERRNRPISRRKFIQAGLATGIVAGVSVLAADAFYSQASHTGQSAQTAATIDSYAARQITIKVNGVNQSVLVEPRTTLAEVLRDNLGLIGTKIACNRMECGACTVLVNGAPCNSCQYLAFWADGRSVLTVEAGISAAAPNSEVSPDPVISALQYAWVEQDGGQCAYCSPGMIMAATALLKRNPNPSIDDIKAALSGNLCRCGNYPNIIASIQLAAKNLGGG